MSNSYQGLASVDIKNMIHSTMIVVLLPVSFMIVVPVCTGSQCYKPVHCLITPICWPYDHISSPVHAVPVLCLS